MLKRPGEDVDVSPISLITPVILCLVFPSPHRQQAQQGTVTFMGVFGRGALGRQISECLLSTC